MTIMRDMSNEHQPMIQATVSDASGSVWLAYQPALETLTVRTHRQSDQQTQGFALSKTDAVALRDWLNEVLNGEHNES